MLCAFLIAGPICAMDLALEQHSVIELNHESPLKQLFTTASLSCENPLRVMIVAGFVLFLEICNLNILSARAESPEAGLLLRQKFSWYRAVALPRGRCAARRPPSWQPRTELRKQARR